MAGYVVDSWAWMEYIRGSVRGKQLKAFLEGVGPVYCSNASLAEVSSKLTRQGLDSVKGREAILANARMIGLDENQAYEAGQIHAEMRKEMADFGLVDAIVLACARKLKAKVVTGDPHFKDVKEAILI